MGHEYKVRYADHAGTLRTIIYTATDVPKEIAKKALYAQSACNINIVRDLDQIVSDLRRHAKDRYGDLYPGTEWINRHPVMVLFVTQMLHLTARMLLPTGYDANNKEIYSACMAVVQEASGLKDGEF